MNKGIEGIVVVLACLALSCAPGTSPELAEKRLILLEKEGCCEGSQQRFQIGIADTVYRDVELPFAVSFDSAMVTVTVSVTNSPLSIRSVLSSFYDVDTLYVPCELWQ